MSQADRDRYARDRERILAKNRRSKERNGERWREARLAKYAADPMRQTLAIWQTMISRCTRPSHDSYAYYGGAGVTVCDRWLYSFNDFVSDMGLRPPDLMLDRIEGSRGYEPGNCRWVTRSEQMKNRRKPNPCTCGTCGQCTHRRKCAERLRAKRAKANG